MLDQVKKRYAKHSRWILAAFLFLAFGVSDQQVVGPSLAATAIAPKPNLPLNRNSRAREIGLHIYLTGYSYWDNTPPQSAAIAKPVLHRRAGGTGTFDNPVTIAVGHKIERGKQTMDFPAGTLFYLPSIKKYAIVEDVCGDGFKPQNGPCHTGYRGYPWLDIYIGGHGGNAHQAETCMRRITGLQNVIMNPRPDYIVHPGEIYRTTCL